MRGDSLSCPAHVNTIASHPVATTKTEAPAERSEFAWIAWPARDHPGRTVVAGAIMVAFAALITSWCLRDGISLPLCILAGVGSLAVLFLALNRFFLVSRFEIDEEGLTARHPLRGRGRRIQWKDVRRFLHDRHGGYLSRRAVRSRFDSWQGVHILWGGDSQKTIDAIRAHLDAAPVFDSAFGSEAQARREARFDCLRR